MAEAAGTVTMGDKEQVLSGSFQTLGMGTETKVRVAWAGDEMTLIFTFNDDPNEAHTKWTGDAIDNATLRITLTNFKSALPAYPVDPIRIGTLANREVFLSWGIQKIPGTTRHFATYSLLAGQEVANG